MKFSPPFAKSPENPKGGLGCLVLFALPFAAVGVFMGGLICFSLYQWGRMQEWEEVPAVILETSLESHDDTYRVTAVYRYRYAGRYHLGKRVGVHSGSDNIGGYHRRIFRELDHHRRNGMDFHAFVNPENPTEAVLYRGLRWEMIWFYGIFVLAFGGAGAGLMIVGFIGRNRQREEDRLRELYPDAPWMHRPDWARGAIKSESKSTMVASLFFAVVWNAISLPVIFLSKEAIAKENWVALVALVFPLAGVALAVWAAKNLARWRRYGRSVLTLDTLPGIVGGPLRGLVHVGGRLEPQGPYRVTLDCIRRETRGTGKSRHTSETILDQEERLIPQEKAEVGPSGPAVPIAFGIRFDSPPTDSSDPANLVLWRLNIEAPVPGVDFAARFEVPVFRTGQSSREYRLQSELPGPTSRPSLPELLARSGVTVERLPDGAVFRFPMARHPGAASWLTLFMAIWSGFIFLMLHLGAPRLFPIVFGLFDLLILAGVLDLWFASGKLVARQGELVLRRGLFGLGREKRFQAADIVGFKPDRGMQAGRKLFYNLVADTRSGKKQVLARRLESREAAERLGDEMEELLSPGKGLESDR